MIDFGLTAVHLGIALGLFYTMHRRGYASPGFLLWLFAGIASALRPVSIYYPEVGKPLELTAVVAFFVVLLFYPGPIRDMQETLRRLTDLRADNKGLKTRVEEAETRAKAAEARIEVHKAFERGLPIAAATFTAPDDLGGGLHFIWGSEPWLPLHDKHELTLERAVGLSHYTMNPEVAENETFRQVHLRVSKTGRPEGDPNDFFNGSSIAWTAWSGPSGGVSMAALRVDGAGPVDSRSPDEIRAHYKAVEEMLSRLEAHHVQLL